ncbi:hypothetical protein [Streptomyces sp. NPDC005859]|uniref:hypothetical protein n=1 Tax=Streptomyces sp. NPDC005859 TaxID=3157170 RepID=UPI0033FC990B
MKGALGGAAGVSPQGGAGCDFPSSHSDNGREVEPALSRLDQLVEKARSLGVANRFVAIADNDTEGIAEREKTLGRSLPDCCRVMFCPSMPVLESYPTLGPYTDEPVTADINGRAGSLGRRSLPWRKSPVHVS